MAKNILKIFITLILVEFLVQGIGYIYTLHERSEIKRRLLASNTSDIKIICLGDSNTFGLESSYGNSYPEQLERLLNKEIKNHKFVVYNLGIIGQNSLQVRDNLERNILTYNPGYIIVLIGVNNRWNTSGRECEVSDDLQIKSRNAILKAVDNLRIVKLFRLIAINLKSTLFFQSLFYNQKLTRVNQNNENTNTLLNEELNYELSQIQNEMQKNNSLWVFKKAIEISEKYPDNADIHAILGRIYYLQYNYKKSIEEYEKALSLKPNTIPLLRGEAVCYRESGDFKKALEIFGFMAKLDPKNETLKMDFRHTFLNFKHKWALSSKEQKTMDYWLKEDLSSIASITSRYKKRLILLTYPTQNWQDEIRKGISRFFDVPLVDIYSIFQRLNNISEYLGKTGGHPNDKGYHVIAQEVFALIRKDLDSFR